MRYRVGFFGWKIAAKLGFTLTAVIEVIFDREEKVYVASSSDIKGLVVEAATLEELEQEIRYATQELLSVKAESTFTVNPEYTIKGSPALYSSDFQIS